MPPIEEIQAPESNPLDDSEQLRKLWIDNVKMRTSLLIVLERLEPQLHTITPSLLVIRECVQELRRYRV